MRLLAYYLPQFHNVSVNDEWWGPGYTEWSAVRKAESLYEGHCQPRIPLNDNYYNLLDKRTMQWQANLMHEYEIDGFCFYHYWFSANEKELHKPAENLLEWKDIDMPFCFSWANESWLYKWRNGEGVCWSKRNGKGTGKRDVIYSQTYFREEWKAHFDYLLPFFKDSRYIKVEGKPVFFIYQLDAIGCLEEMIAFWRQCAKKEGFEDLYIVGNGSLYRKYGVDCLAINEPGTTQGRLTSVHLGNGPTRLQYDDAWECILQRRSIDEKPVIQGGFLPFDNTPRYGMDGVVYEGATSDKVCDYFARLMAKNEKYGIGWTTVNAWNEWAEGMYLEPDQTNGYAMLEAIREAKHTYQKYCTEYVNKSMDAGAEEKYLGSEKAKMTIYFEAFNRWMRLREKRIAVVEYLLKREVSSIYIYGAGYLTPHLMWECRQSGIAVNGIIDAKANGEMEGVPICHMSDDFPMADAIVVTAFFHMHDIVRLIRQYDAKVPIYSLDELIQAADSYE